MQRTQRNSRLLQLVVLAMSLSSAPLMAQEKDDSQLGRFAPARQGLVSSSWVWNQAAPVADEVRSGYHSYALNMNVPLYLGEDYLLTGSLSYAHEAVSWESDDAREGNVALHQPGLALTHLFRLAPGWHIIARTAAQVASDFQGHLSEHDFHASAQVLAAHMLSPSWQLLFGAAVVLPSEWSPIVPMIGLNYRSSGGWFRFDLLLPSHLEIGASLSRRLDLFARTQYVGDQWDMHRPGVHDLHMTRRELRASAGLDIETWRGLRLWLEGGTALWRETGLATREIPRHHLSSSSPNAFMMLGVYVTADLLRSPRR